MTIEQRHNLNQKKQQAERRGDRKTPDNAKNKHKIELAKAKAAIYGLNAELQIQKRKTNDWEKAYIDLVGEIHAFDQEVAKREVTHKTNYKNLLSEHYKIQAESSTLQEIIDDLKFQLKDAEKEIADLEEANHNLRKKVEELEENADNSSSSFYVEIGMREKDFC